MANYTQALFSLSGVEPQYLPARMRLHNKETRYSHSITLAELSSLGYSGPFNKPSVSDAQYLTWSTGTSSWVVNSKTPQQRLEDADREIRASIDDTLSHAVDVTDPDLSETAFNIYAAYYAKLHSLSLSTTPLTVDKLPTLELPQVTSKAAEDKAAEDEIDRMLTDNTANWKQHYELDGMKLWEDSLHPEVGERFTLPSDWVASGTAT